MNKSRIEDQNQTVSQRLLAHLRTPLYRNGYALTLSSLASSGLGMVYWILAAHRYTARDIGVNSAVISAMMFLAGVSELNLMSALIRFIPTAGRSTKRFVFYSYLVSVVLAAVFSFAFIKWVPDWTAELHFLESNLVLTFWFVLSTMAWCIFVLQDSVLTGLRQATWVLVENTVFSLAKIGFMVIFAVTIPAIGIFASWSLAVLVAVLPTNYFIFQRLIPHHVRLDSQKNGRIEPRQVIRFAAADYLGAMSWLVITTLLPLIVTAVAGAQANAYFYLSWTIANSLYLISTSMGASLVVEASKDPHKLGTYSYQVFRNMAKIVIPVALVLVVGAPFVLMVFGRGYSSQGANLLRLLAISGIPNIINAIFVSVARIQRRTEAVAVALGSLAVLVLSLSYVMLKNYGIVGVGIGWLVAQSIVAGVVYLTQLHGLWAKASEEIPQDYANPTNGITSRLIIPALYSLAIRSRLFPVLKVLRKKWAVQHNRSRVKYLLPELRKNLPKDVYDPDHDHLQILHIADTVTNTTVAFLGPIDEPPPIVLKIPGSSKDEESQKKQYEKLIALCNDDRLDGWRKLLPVVLAEGKVGDHAYFIERALPGMTLKQFLRDPVTRQQVISLAVAEIGTLHQKTVRRMVVDDRLLQHWIMAPLDTMKRLSSSRVIGQAHLDIIDRLASGLSAVLGGSNVCTCWVHGDYSPSNILIDPTGSEVTGIVDWDLAHPDGLPLLDLVHLFLSVRMELQQLEIGHVVLDLLAKGDWTTEEQLLIQAAQNSLPGEPVNIRVMILLCWLQHIHANLSKTTRFTHHRVWIAENIVSVLEALDHSNTNVMMGMDLG